MFYEKTTKHLPKPYACSVLFAFFVVFELFVVQLFANSQADGSGTAQSFALDKLASMLYSV
jgi:hypothetical protein